MLLAFILIGALIGASLEGGSGLVFGGLIGFLVGRVKQLSDRLSALELSRQAPGAAEAAWEPPVSESTGPTSEDARFEPEATSEPTAPELPERDTPAGRPWEAAGAETSTSAMASMLSAVEDVLGRIKGWFTSGNVPVKVGVVLSLFGVAFMIREAIDRELFNLPIEYRLMGVALFGLGLLILGWRLRESRPGYALSVQGGGIAVLYLTTYAAYGVFGLMPAGAAFGLLLIFTMAVGALAVLQDSRALAVLGIVGGFMAPVLASTGSGNHVLLFSYYAILNTAIVGVAWFKAWRMLNVLGFVFTFAIGSLWGYQGYRAEHFATTEPFLILFVLMYTLIPVLFAHRQPPDLRGFVDGTLVFGTPIVGFGLQTRLVGDTEYGLALSAIVLAGLYVLLATFLHRKAKDLRVLMESFFGLGLVFLTIAVPLALDARWTSVAWALQGAAMVWLAFRQRRRLALLAGVVLQLLAGATYIEQPGFYSADSTPLLNGYFLGAVLIAAAGGFSSRLLDRGGDSDGFAFRFLAWLSLGWATAWWLFAGLAEIDLRLGSAQELSASLIFVAATAGVAALAAKRLEWLRLNALGLLLLPAMVFGYLLSLVLQAHPLARYGWLAWPIAIGVHYAFLRYRESQFPRLTPVLHTGAYWVLAALIAGEFGWQVDQLGDGVWPRTAEIVAVALFVVATLRSRELLDWPVARHWGVYSSACMGGVLLAVLGAVLGNNLVSPGDPTPLPYVPLMNPLALTSLFALFVIWRWLTANRGWWDGSRFVPLIVAAISLFLLTMAVARAVHHWGGVPFDLELLGESVVFQTSLSMVWGITGLLGMVLGARFTRREVWIGGAALMAVVVVKLFLVELDNTGTVGRVVSFLGVGVLLLIVGYFAPAPPRLEREAEAI